MELTDVLTIQVLPRCCRFGNLVDRKGLARVPLLGIDQGIDAPRLQVDSHQIAGLQFPKPRTRQGFG